jgi:hypothetical protein
LKYIFQANKQLTKEAKEDIRREIVAELKSGTVLLDAGISFVAALMDDGKTEVKINED